MVRFVTHLIGAAVVLSALTGAAPTRKRDSAIGEEVAVSAPDGGSVTSDTAELASQLGISTGDLPQTTSFADDSSATIDPAAIPTDDVTSGEGAVASGGDVTVSSTDAIPPPLPTDVSPPTVVSSPPSSGYSYPSYGSGSSSWMVSYNSCVQTCMVQYPPPPTQISIPDAPPSVSSGSIESGSGTSVEGSGTSVESPDSATNGTDSGTVWNIMVAPVDGVFRYVPFYVNAAVGDTVRFTWVHGPHTVTQSSPIAPCNHSIGGFTSGKQNASFVFDQVINSTDPVFFYCGVPSHCQKGMFGAINPTAAPGSNTSVGAMMEGWAAANPDIATVLNSTNTLAVGLPAMEWGNGMDVSNIDPSLHPALAKDILFTRQVMAANPHMVDANGKFNPTGQLTIPADVSNLLDTADAGSPGGPVNAAVSTSSTSSSSTASPTTSSTQTTPTANAAMSMKSSGLAVALVAVVAAFFAL